MIQPINRIGQLAITAIILIIHILIIVKEAVPNQFPHLLLRPDQRAIPLVEAMVVNTAIPICLPELPHEMDIMSTEAEVGVKADGGKEIGVRIGSACRGHRQQLDRWV